MLSRRPDAFDLAVALGLALLSALLSASLVAGLPTARQVLVWGLLAVHTLCLARRRRAPLGTFAVHLAAGLGVLLAGLPMVALGLAPLVGVYTVGLCRPRRPAAWALVAAVLALLVGEAAGGFAQQPSTVLVNGAALAAAWAAGRFVHARNADLRALDARNRELLAARDDLARAAVTEERLRMARDLHDIVAHSLSMIAVQAGAGAHVAVADPEAAGRALRAIGDVSRQALSEMRHVVKVLRDGAGAELAPVPGLDRLDALADQVAGSGLQVDLVRLGAGTAAVPAAVDATAYRIVQESLTNVVRHADARFVRVRVTCTTAEVGIEVVDDGRRAAGSPAGGGHGLVGMRERVQLLGGTLHAGPLPDGGFRVAARLPVTPALPVPAAAP